MLTLGSILKTTHHPCYDEHVAFIVQDCGDEMLRNYLSKYSLEEHSCRRCRGTCSCHHTDQRRCCLRPADGILFFLHIFTGKKKEIHAFLTKLPSHSKKVLVGLRKGSGKMLF